MLYRTFYTVVNSTQKRSSRLTSSTYTVCDPGPQNQSHGSIFF